MHYWVLTNIIYLVIEYCLFLAFGVTLSITYPL